MRTKFIIYRAVVLFFAAYAFWLAIEMQIASRAAQGPVGIAWLLIPYTAGALLAVEGILVPVRGLFERLKVKFVIYRVVALPFAGYAFWMGWWEQAQRSFAAQRPAHDLPLPGVGWMLIPYALCALLLLEAIFVPVRRMLERKNVRFTVYREVVLLLAAVAFWFGLEEQWSRWEMLHVSPKMPALAPGVGWILIPYAICVLLLAELIFVRLPKMGIKFITYRLVLLFIAGIAFSWALTMQPLGQLSLKDIESDWATFVFWVLIPYVVCALLLVEGIFVPVRRIFSSLSGDRLIRLYWCASTSFGIVSGLFILWTYLRNIPDPPDPDAGEMFAWNLSFYFPCVGLSLVFWLGATYFYIRYLCQKRLGNWFAVALPPLLLLPFLYELMVIVRSQLALWAYLSQLNGVSK